MSGGGAILLVLSPSLSGLCLAIFTVLWGFTILYGSYSRHSQRVVQVRAPGGSVLHTHCSAPMCSAGMQKACQPPFCV